MFLDIKWSATFLGSSGINNLLVCFYVLQNSIATSFPAPTDSIIENTCKNPIQLPSNLKDKEQFILKKIYGFDKFKEGQLEAISSITQGKDTLVLIPTGGVEKVLPTLLLEFSYKVCVVIEPLKFIMEEQAEKLRAKQIPAFYFNSSLTDTEMDYVVNAICRRDFPYVVLFSSPVCILSTRLQFVLESWYKIGRLSFIAVDEAHCIDMWGHGFRPDFLKLGSLKDYKVPIMALTGTVTERAQFQVLKLHQPNTIQVKHVRKNLFLNITPKKVKPKKTGC